MPSKKSTATKKRRKTDVVPDAEPHYPLNGKPWKGHDGAQWIDLAVDSRSSCVMLWLRKTVKSGQYFLIASCVGAHIMKKELTEQEARSIYSDLPDKAPFPVVFMKRKAPVKKDKAEKKGKKKKK